MAGCPKCAQALSKVRDIATGETRYVCEDCGFERDEDGEKI